VGREPLILAELPERHHCGTRAKEALSAFADPLLTFRRRPQIMVWWISTLAWAAEIFYLSSPSFGSSFSRSLLTELLAHLGLSVSGEILGMLNSFCRSLAHLTEYAILTILLYGSLASLRPCFWQPRLACWCIAAATGYSLIDELHQAFVPGRGASLLDSAIDAAGAALGVAILYGYWRLSERRRLQKMKSC